MSEDKPVQDEKVLTDNITIKRSNYKKLIIGVVVSLIALSFFGGYVTGEYQVKKFVQTIQTVPQIIPQALPQTNGGKIFFTAGTSPVQGSKDAPLTIVEFADFQCPFCERFFSDTLSQIQHDYIDTGKVKLVYRDFPLQSIHPNAFAASLAAQCANEQGKFWEYHDLLFSDQQTWAPLNSVNATNTFKQYALDLKLDSPSFDSCLDSAKYQDVIKQNQQEGISYHVTGTPTFFIGDDKDGYIPVVGAQPYSAFEQVIQQQLH
jgi:protein-disulfide isomerase